MRHLLHGPQQGTQAGGNQDLAEAQHGGQQRLTEQTVTVHAAAFNVLGLTPCVRPGSYALRLVIVALSVAGLLFQAQAATHSQGCKIICESKPSASIASLVCHLIAVSLGVAAICKSLSRLGSLTPVCLGRAVLACRHWDGYRLLTLFAATACAALSLRRCWHVILFIARVPQGCRHLSVPISVSNHGQQGGASARITIVTYHNEPNRAEVAANLADMRQYAGRYGYEVAVVPSGLWRDWQSVGGVHIGNPYASDTPLAEAERPVLPPLADSALLNSAGINKTAHWAKIKLLYWHLDHILAGAQRDALRENPSSQAAAREHWLVWLDGDAVIRNHAIRLEQVISAARASSVQRCGTAASWSGGLWGAGDAQLLQRPAQATEAESVVQRLHRVQPRWYGEISSNSTTSDAPSFWTLVVDALSSFVWGTDQPTAGKPMVRREGPQEAAPSEVDGADVELIVTMAPDTSLLCGELTSALNSGVLALRVSHWSAGLLREVWYDDRFNDMTATHKWHEQGALQFRLCSGGMRTEDVMEASQHPTFRNRANVSFGCRSSLEVQRLEAAAPTKPLLSSNNDSSPVNVSTLYRTCTPIPLSKFRAVSMANLNSPPYSWSIDERTMAGDFIAHPAGDSHKATKVAILAERAVATAREEAAAVSVEGAPTVEDPLSSSCWWDTSVWSQCYRMPLWMYFA